jgi:hypothetical protein
VAHSHASRNIAAGGARRLVRTVVAHSHASCNVAAGGARRFVRTVVGRPRVQSCAHARGCLQLAIALRSGQRYACTSPVVSCCPWRAIRFRWMLPVAHYGLRV